MSSRSNDDFMATPEGFQRCRDAFHKIANQIGPVLACTGALTETSLSERRFGLGRLLVSLWATSSGLLKVAVHPSLVESTFIVARAVLEREVNAAFLAVCDKDDYEGFIQHALQKRYRDMERTVGSGSTRVDWRQASKPDPGTVPGLEDALRRFTSKKDREKNWTDLGLAERVEAVANAEPGCTPLNFSFAVFRIYSTASEMAHGSLFGSIVSVDPNFHFDDDLGDYTWERSSADMASVFMVLAGSTLSLLKVLAARADVQVMRDIATRAEEEHASFRDFLKENLGDDESAGSQVVFSTSEYGAGSGNAEDRKRR